MPDDVLERFSPATRAWFRGAFAAPTPAQAGAWESIARGDHTLVVAPTGSGKTLAAFLWSLDRLAAAPPPDDRERRCRVLYVSPLKALAVDVERNLRAPLTGIRQAARRLGLPEPDVRVGVRSGDTPADDRRRLVTRPPDILITTPESLFLMLTSQARQMLRGVETVIVDEVHAVAGTKRGAHLALSLERLDVLLERPAQRIGLSATVRPAEEVATFLAGSRRAEIVQAAALGDGDDPRLDLRIVVPVEDMGEPGVTPDGPADDPARRSIWPHVEERVLDLIESHRSTIVFANSRRQAERLCGRLNELAYERRYGPSLPDAPVPAEMMAQAGAGKGAPAEVARAHHGSVSKEERAGIEDSLKQGRLPAVVATSSLELGIDMGAVDLVVQVGAPPSVAGGLQRVGRAGHQVGAVSKGVIFPKYRGDLLQTAVVAERMGRGEIEELRYPRNPLDVLAQQIVAMAAMDEWTVDDLETVVRRAAPFASLPRSALEATLDMLAGRYPSEEFGELRPRLVWDRVAGVLRGRPGAQRLAVTSGGTIPDRGLFGVFLVGERSSRVGELDEEMVYESRVGDVFVLGASSWRIEDITPDRVLVSPAPGQPGKLPFWHGDSPGRPAELGRALGTFARELSRLPRERAAERVRAAGLDEWAAGNLVSYLEEQRESTGYVPDDRTLVVERFRDELGDWRLVVHSPFGARVHAPWALAIAGRLRERHGVDAQAMHADDGIVLRIPDSDEPPRMDLALFDPDDIERIVVDELGSSALFAARFRECAARSLLLPRRRPDRRMPLWQQRQRAAQLLSVASRYSSFPIVLETMRECLQDVFDVPGLVRLMRDLAGRRTRMVEVETPAPSPFARSLLFHYVGAFMYEGDAPLAERRAQALALDSSLLAELLGQADLRELLDPEIVAETERELQRLTPDRRAKDAEGVADLLRVLGPLSTGEVAARITPPGAREGVSPEARRTAGEWLAELEGTRRVIRVRIAGAERWAAVEDAGRLRDALGVPLPVGVPEAFLEIVDDPLGDLVLRYARTHGPFRAGDVAARFGLGPAVVLDALRRQAAAGRVTEGEFLPVEALSGPVASEWCETGVLRMLRRRCLARLRAEVEPSPPEALGRFLPAWHGITAGRLRGMDALVQAVEQLQGAAVPASALESLVLPARVPGYSPALLDELTSAGEVVWAGQGGLPGGDGWVSLYLADTAPLLLPEPAEITTTPAHEAVLETLSDGGALFFRNLSDRVNAAGLQVADQDLVAVLWDLVWAGRLTNDTLAPLRATLGSGRPAHRPRTSRRGRPVLPSRTGPPTVAGRWWLLPEREPDTTRRSHALAEVLLERHGVVIRGAVAAERAPGGFAAVYPVLRGLEETGRCRRGYFVEGLGAAQFAVPGAVDRLRALREPSRPKDDPDELWLTPAPAHRSTPDRPPALVLAAADPANPYGAALPWPEREGETAGGHKPGRKAGALVVLVDGALVLYVERGGRTLLSWTDDPGALQPAVDALALAVREGALGKLTVERADGEAITSSPLAQALEAAGFHPTPRGLRLRS
ncbi:ATP-dependent helicase [Thermomonospora cellulosilytica]|uniref:ATP-dependent Lhr-like helicase n=1 Tax=Thermomonospora cellulosilytica TaxID=1411118 RepID=A0A7W3N3M5_9ACTN|nr:ATP-dependent helicase [Thermomonospora cellulosilytica]MBA9006953.1 ATP-dependent Lhr-like helicase [Thermomonospora cellulosilytica]